MPLVFAQPAKRSEHFSDVSESLFRPPFLQLIFQSSNKSQKTQCTTYFATLAKTSRERELARPGGGFGRMIRSPWHPAGKLGAQPSGTFSCQQEAN